MQGAFVNVQKGEVFINNLKKGTHQEANTPKNYDQTRSRKLLLHKKEADYLYEKIQQKGLTLVPIRLYNKKGLIKVEIAVAKGKREYDKREIIKKRETDRKIRRTLKN